MDPVAEIERARAATLVDDDGAAVTLTVEPPLSATEIATLEAQLGVALPGELRAALAYAAGLGGVLESIDFSGRATAGFGLEEILPHGLSIADDGFGNSWVVDLAPPAGDVAPVFFACHDPPVILVQSPSLGHFLHELFRLYVPPHASLVDDVHEDRLFEVSRRNPGVLTRADALASADDVLASFASSLDEGYELVDLRGAPVGMGFQWGRYGPRTELRRAGHEPVFAYRRPPGRPGRLRRLLG